MKTTKIKKVLIALDHNPAAQKVAEAGFELAKAIEAEITLLHVISDPVYYSSVEYSPITGYIGNMDSDQPQTENADGLRKASKTFLEESKLHLGDEAIETKVLEGDFADSIIKTAKDIRADMIVMGSHNRKWLDNIVMGNVTETVLHHTAIPLVIIPVNKPG